MAQEMINIQGGSRLRLPPCDLLMLIIYNELTNFVQYSEIEP